MKAHKTIATVSKTSRLFAINRKLFTALREWWKDMNALIETPTSLSNHWASEIEKVKWEADFLEMKNLGLTDLREF